MRSVKNCPKCGSSRNLMQKYFGEPLMKISKVTPDEKFIVEASIDICMNCNTVYANRWETIRVEDMYVNRWEDNANQEKQKKKEEKQTGIAHSEKKEPKKEVRKENSTPALKKQLLTVKA